MRAALIALMLLLVAPEALAGGAVWQGNRVVVRDYASPAWNGVVAQTVTDFNAMLPKKAPRLVYRAMGERDCQHVKKVVGAIVVCNTAAVSAGGHEVLAAAPYVADHGAVVWAKIMLSRHAETGHHARTLCHEMMHATTGIGDDYGAAPDTSCVWGNLSSPGPFDVAYARKAYKKHR